MISFSSFIPFPLRSDSKWMDFYNYVEEKFNEMISGSDKVKYSYDGLNRNISSLEHFARQEAAYVLEKDDSRTMRKVIYYSREIQRCPYCFSGWKNIIDMIAGGDSQIYLGQIRILPFIVERSRIEGLDTLGDDGFTELDNNLVETDLIVGDNSTTLGTTPNYNDKGLQNQNPGDVFIDLNTVGTPKFSTANSVVERLYPLLTSVFRFYIGYIDGGSGDFIILTELRP